MRKGVKADASMFLLIAIAAVLVVGGFLAYQILRSDPIEEALAGKEPVNILFIFEGEEKPLGSYVLEYSPGNNRAAAISIPGEVGLILKTIDRVDRIDAVYEPHRADPFRQEIERLLEITIHYTIVFEQEKLGKIVDLIEGVEIFVSSPIEVYEDEPILFPSGNIRLDGDKARQYISFELPEEDRTEASLRRERFFLGFLKGVGEKRAFLEKPQTAALFYSLMKTGMNRPSREKLFQSLAVLDMDRVMIQPVAGNYREVSGQRLLMPYYDGTVIKDIVRQSQRSLAQQVLGSLVERIFTVEILNGTTSTGLAGRTAELIRGFSYDVVATGNAGHNDYEKTEIIDRTGIDDAVNTFAAVLQCKNIRHEEKIPDTSPLADNDSGSRADFTLILGKDFNGRVVN